MVGRVPPQAAKAALKEKGIGEKAASQSHASGLLIIFPP
jgi:hypothetical protein